MIDTGAGVVDADYRGIVKVLLFNLSDRDFEGNLEHVFHDGDFNILLLLVEEGDRVAQLILERVCTPDVFEVQVSSAIYFTCKMLIDSSGPGRNFTWRGGLRLNRGSCSLVNL